MYDTRPNLMLGFHGCDESVRDRLVQNPDIIRRSKEVFDWLGHGFYVWENNYERALQWAGDKKKRDRSFGKPAVLGVVFQLDHCLDFTDSAYTSIIETYYLRMKYEFQLMGTELPRNKGLRGDEYQDMVIRELDCSVIEYLHDKIDQDIRTDLQDRGFSELRHFDTVRGIFTEGGPAFEGAGIRKKNHIQICIRNFNCIKGFFIPRKRTLFPPG